MTKHRTLADLMAAGATIPAISYARVSSEKQLSGEGLTRQRKGTLDWIAKHPEYRIRLDDEKSDEARSAWKGDHVFKSDSALGKLLEMVKVGELRPPLMIIVEALDRLSRENPWTAQERLAGLVTRGIFVATTKDDKIYSLASGIGDIIMSVVSMSAAHQESESKSVRVRATKAIRVSEAQTTKHVLHKNVPGWLHVADPISSTNRASRTYERIERHCTTLQTIYQMALHHGSAYITAWLIENKVQPFGRSGRWCVQYVQLILASRAPMGHLETRHGLIEDTLPAVISEDLWLRVQAARDVRRGNGGPKLAAYVNLFAGISTCVECGGKMRMNQQKERRYYECNNHVVLHTCANRSRYRVDVLEIAVLDDLGWLTIGGAVDKPPENLAELSDTLATLRAREQRLAARLKTLDDDSMFDVVMGQLRELRDEMNDASTRLSAAQKATAVAAAPIQIDAITDRPKLHTALRRLIKGAYFGDGHEVAILSNAGLLLMVTARQDAAAPYLMMLRHDGQMAIVDGDRKLRITEAATELVAAGMTLLDARTIDDVLTHLRRTRQDRGQLRGPHST